MQGRFGSLLLPLDGSAESAKSAPCALWLAEQLGATLHVLHVGSEPLRTEQALEKLGIPLAGRPEIVVHQTNGDVVEEIVNAVDKHGIGLIIMSARGQSYSGENVQKRRLGGTARHILERCDIPVILVPLHYRQVLPWQSMLAAASGDAAASQALEVAAQLAALLKVKVNVMHADAGSTTRYADMVHHEYPQRIEEMVERGLAGCTHEECRQVEQALIRYGDPAKILLKQVALDNYSVLALGWHGSLDEGRALVLKHLLEQAGCVLLIIKGVSEAGSTLLIRERLNG